MDAETVQAAPALAAHLQNSPVRRASTVAVLRGFWPFASPIAFCLPSVDLFCLSTDLLIGCCAFLCAALACFFG